MDKVRPAKARQAAAERAKKRRSCRRVLQQRLKETLKEMRLSAQEKLKLKLVSLATKLSTEREMRRSIEKDHSVAIKSLASKLEAAEKQVAKEQRKFEKERSIAKDHSVAIKSLASKLEAAEKQVAKEQRKFEKERSIAKDHSVAIKSLASKLEAAEKQVAKEQRKFEKERSIAKDHSVAIKSLASKLEAAEKQVAKEQRKFEKERSIAKDHSVAIKSLASKLEAAEKQVAKEQRKLEKAQKQLQEMERAQKLLQARLQEQTRISSLASHGEIWQYEETNGWNALPLEGSDQMTHAYLMYLHDPTPTSRFAIINSAGVAREVDFELMQQKRTDTNKVRNIRLWPGVPARWTTSPAELLLQSDDLPSFYVRVTDAQVHAKVLEVLQSTGHARDITQQCSCIQTARIKSIYRIEHQRLWQRYKVRREALRKEHATYNFVVTPASLDLDAFDAGPGSSQVMTNNQACFDCGEDLDVDVDEKILLHGTSGANADFIVLNGFDHRTCSHGMYGDGVYFASSACKSHQYTCSHKTACVCEEDRTLIIARVALGDAYHAKETRYKERRPPVKNTFGVTYDSIVVNPGPIKGHHRGNQIHQEFVIFDREQAYPCYVVRYEM